MNRELPPRARRIRQVRFRNIPNDGTTSACAENTGEFFTRQHRCRNYLRVRGEYLGRHWLAAGLAELPPRARRILTGAQSMTHTIGTTSACAENTSPGNLYRKQCWNYLRVRGEYFWREELVSHTMELPPRARRIREGEGGLDGAVGTTSACAENTA